MLYYLGYYNCDAIRDENRIVSPASESKMGYIISTLSDATEEVFQVISPAETKEHRFIKGRTQRLNEKAILKTFSSFCSKSKLIRGLGHLFTRFQLLFYLLKNITKNDHLLVYHSLYLMKFVKIVKKIKKCRLTIEVEELYADVSGNEKLRNKEISYLQIADRYIFITKYLRETINEQKPSIISHGIYNESPDFGFRFNDEMIHVVYAGTFNQIKGGALVAVSIAEYLDERYILELLGTGSTSDICSLKKKIQEVICKTKCKINYIGLKTGDGFSSYIQGCHIGLSTQNADAKFGATSFPSKILMYMSNGLRVVSVRIPAIEDSAVGKYIYYYDDQNPEEIAKVIRSVSLNDGYDSKLLLKKLNSDFILSLKSVILR